MLGIGSALMCAPRLLLVDELSLGLAPLVVRDLMERLRGARAARHRALVVEQNAQVALDIADHAYVMENGRVVLDGTPERLRAHQDIQEFYLGGAGAAAAIATSSSTVAAAAGMAELRVSPAPRVRRSARAPRRVVQRAPASFSRSSGRTAGKTSILNCISGLYRPTAARSASAARARRAGAARHRALGIARTFQHGELFLHMSVVENLLVARHAILRTNLVADAIHLPAVREPRRAPAARRGDPRFRRARALPSHGGRRLPFGLQKLVGFARALAMEPQASCSTSRPRASTARSARTLRATSCASSTAGHRDDLGRARHADGRRPRGPGMR